MRLSQENRDSGSYKKYGDQLLRLAQEATFEINKLPPPVVQFCGPISTGGFGDTEENLACLSSFIKTAKEFDIHPRLTV